MLTKRQCLLLVLVVLLASTGIAQTPGTAFTMPNDHGMILTGTSATMPARSGSGTSRPIGWQLTCATGSSTAQRTSEKGFVPSLPG